MNYKILKIVIFLLCLATSAMAQTQDIQQFIAQQMKAYPKSRLIDIYKSCFQDFMGAEHLVGDRQSAKKYLDDELKGINENELTSWFYEPCGIDGNYVRVNLQCVKDGLVDAEVLLDAFVRSANVQRPMIGDWQKRWTKIVEIIENMNLQISNYQEDKAFINKILSAGKYAVSHSTDYREAYHPHYRIIERKIFESEIKPLIIKR